MLYELVLTCIVASLCCPFFMPKLIQYNLASLSVAHSKLLFIVIIRYDIEPGLSHRLLNDVGIEIKHGQSCEKFSVHLY